MLCVRVSVFETCSFFLNYYYQLFVWWEHCDPFLGLFVPHCFFFLFEKHAITLYSSSRVRKCRFPCPMFGEWKSAALVFIFSMNYFIRGLFRQLSWKENVYPVLLFVRMNSYLLNNNNKHPYEEEYGQSQVCRWLQTYYRLPIAQSVWIWLITLNTRIRFPSRIEPWLYTPSSRHAGLIPYCRKYNRAFQLR